MSNNNSNNNTSVSNGNTVSTTSTPSAPLPSVTNNTSNKNSSSNSVSNNSTKSSIKAKSKETEKIETVTIPKADFDKLSQELTFWRNRCSQLSTRLDRIGGALIQVQGSVYNAKNSIISNQ